MSILCAAADHWEAVHLACCADPARFSPVSELLPEGSQTEAVLIEAAAANEEAEARDKSYEDLADSKQGYISQVRQHAALLSCTYQLTATIIGCPCNKIYSAYIVNGFRRCTSRLQTQWRRSPNYR